MTLTVGYPVFQTFFGVQTVSETIFPPSIKRKVCSGARQDWLADVSERWGLWRARAGAGRELRF